MPSGFSGFDSFNPRARGMAGVDPFSGGNDLSVPEGFNASAVGLAGVNPMGGNAPRPSGTPTPRPPVGLAGMGGHLGFADGGSVPEGAISEEDELGPMGNTFGAQMDQDIRGALSVVNRVLNFGRKSNGLPEVQYEEKQDEAIETAGVMPAVPHSETPKPQPMPGPIPLRPWEKPFGKRVDAGEEAAPEGEEPFEMAGVLPSQPFSETPKPQPMPGPLPPTSNPFGKRVDAEMPDDEQTEAISTEEETA